MSNNAFMQAIQLAQLLRRKSGGQALQDTAHPQVNAAEVLTLIKEGGSRW